jgi:hypothetical protein
VVDLSIQNRPDRVAPGIADGLWQTAAARYTDGPFDSVLQAALGDWVAGGKEIALVSLVGMGEGFTPSGDDIMVGVLAGLDFCANAVVRCEACRASLVAALPMPLEDHTTRLSAQMMAAAANCQYVETLPALAAALAAPMPDWLRVEATAEDLLRLGHCSGRDLLAGFAATLVRNRVKG